MALNPFSPLFRHHLDDTFHDLNRFQQGLSPSSLNGPNANSQIVNDKEKFGVSLDVSHFKPEELKVSLDGHILTIQGEHEIKDDEQYLKRAFIRKWTLPEECDLNGVKSTFSKDGHLCIDAPKIPRQSMSRAIPIEGRQ